MIKEMLLMAPDGQLDASVKPLIEKWDDEPTALQVFEVIDHCTRYALASGFTMRLIQLQLDTALKRENIEYEDLLPLATWRDRADV